MGNWGGGSWAKSSFAVLFLFSLSLWGSLECSEKSTQAGKARRGSRRHRQKLGIGAVKKRKRRKKRWRPYFRHLHPPFPAPFFSQWITVRVHPRSLGADDDRRWMSTFSADSAVWYYGADCITKKYSRTWPWTRTRTSTRTHAYVHMFFENCCSATW